MSKFKIIKNTLYYGIVPKLSMIVSMLILPLTTPFLTTYDYGINGVISSYTSTMLSIAPLGLNLYLTNSFFEIPQKFRLVWGRVFWWFLISGLLFGIINIIILFNVLPLKPSFSLLVLCILGSSQIFLFGPQKVADHLYPLVERPKPLVFTNLLCSISGIVVSFVLIYFLRMGYWGLLSNYVCSSLLSFAFFSFFLHKQYNIKPIIERNWKRFREMLKSSLPLIPHTLGFVLLANSARIVMSIHDVEYSDIGLYSHGCVMGNYIIAVTTAVTTALAPYLQRSYREGDYNRYRKLYYLNQIIALAASFLICIWMSEVYAILIRNETLKESASIATFMCFSQVLNPLYVFMSTSCFVERKTKKLLWLVFVPGFTNLALCYFLIPIWGYRVAIYSTLISYWTQLLMPIAIPYFRTKTIQWLGTRWKLLLLLIVVLIFLFIGNLFAHSSFFVKIIVSIVSVFLFFTIYRTKKLSSALY